MKYIVYKRFKGKGIGGNVNLAVGTDCVSSGGVIYYNQKQICFDTSKNSHDHFARNDDEQGLLRGKLTQAIQKRLAKQDNNYQNRWNKIWDDTVCKQYKRHEHLDHWLWNHEFFGAPIEDLRHIANLIGIREEKL